LVGGHQVEYGSIEINAQIDRPDILGEVVAEVPVTRVTAKKVIEDSGRLAEATLNPAMFITQVARSIRRALAATIKNKDGIAYTPIDERYEAKLFMNEQKCYERNLVPVNKSIYAKVPVDSHVEREFVTKIDKRDDILLFVKLPEWYKISTPVGGYNPDWAIVKKSETEELELYLVRETKGTSNMDDWFREAEAWKVKFGSKHYEALGVDYKVVQTAEEIYTDVNP
jgi:type III restriction enzyme